MSEIDINYIANSLANLTSLPVRVYENGKIKKSLSYFVY